MNKCGTFFFGLNQTRKTSMNKTRILSIAAIALTWLVASHTTLAAASDKIIWKDGFLGYRYGDSFREPGNPQKISKYVLQLQYAQEDKLGSGFMNLDMLKSCGGADPKQDSSDGATEYYFVYRSTPSISKFSKGKIKFGGIIRDIGVTIGCDLSSKNDAFGSQVRELFVGPTVSFNVPGFLTVGLLLDKENNKNGIVGKRVYFDPTYCVSVAWGMPILKTPFSFKGFANFLGTKGKDGFGNDTAPETLIEAAITIDPFFNKPARKGKYLVGIGYQYWNNKFGNDATYDPTGGSRASTAQLQLECHF